MNKIRVAVFASGSGTNAKALIEKAKSLENIEFAFGLCDQGEAAVLQEPLFEFLPISDQKKWERDVFVKIRSEQVDWILLAGFMRILSPWFLSELRRFHGGKNQVLNIHPSLLPKYKGLNAYKKAFENGDRELGATIHFVVPEVDAGEILLQRKFLIAQDASLEEVIQVGKQVENQMYSEILEKISQGGVLNHVVSY